MRVTTSIKYLMMMMMMMIDDDTGEESATTKCHFIKQALMFFAL